MGNVGDDITYIRIGLVYQLIKKHDGIHETHLGLIQLAVLLYLWYLRPRDRGYLLDYMYM